MSKFKKLTTISLVAAIAFSTMSMGAFASDISNNFNITTSVGDNHQIIKVYDGSMNSPMSSESPAALSNDNEYAETKALLSELGMEQYAIDNLTDEDLEKYANSKKIVAAVSYSKVDENNEITYLNETTATEEAAEITERQTAKMYNTANGIQTADQGTYEDSYMRVFFMTTYHWDGSYTFSTDARWLTMPVFRWSDVIGASAQHCTVTPSTRSGYVEYDRLLIGPGINSSEEIHSELNASNFQEANDGTFYGSGAIIDLPFDAINTGGTSMYYQDYKAHYQYDGHVLDPATAHYFNAVGSYTHSRATISWSPSISIGVDGVSGSLGISGLGVQDVRDVLLEIYYY